MSLHTPGPWNLNNNTTHWKTNIFSITVRKHGVHATAVANIPARAKIPTSEAWANARLIAAAPDMLGALQMLDIRGGLGLQTHEYIRSIINKATIGE
jgi:hypothetical protein